MSWGAIAAAVITAVAGAANANQQAKDAAGAAGRQQRLQEQEMARLEAERNKKNARRPDKGAFYSDATTGGTTAGPTSGLGGTLLTGPGGIDSSLLELGKRTLLG